jgi:hypothetical protein
MKDFYQVICWLYSYLITFFEKNFLYLKKHKDIFYINKKGYEILKSNIDVGKIINEKEIKVNKYTDKIIISENSLYNFLNYLFLEKNLANQITRRTGYKYSVDFFTNYRTFHVPNYDRNGDWFANKWHNDKPFSENTLKIIIPLNDMSSGNYGGIKILDIDQSKNLVLKKENNSLSNFFEMKSSLEELLIFLPKLCYHKAGIPNINFKRSQIMIQLNPAKKWCINNNIYKKQFNLEPKFPFFNYLLEKKTYLETNLNK